MTFGGSFLHQTHVLETGRACFGARLVRNPDLTFCRIVVRGRPTRVSHKRVPYKSVLQQSTREFPSRVVNKSVPQECPTRECPLRVCYTRVSPKSVSVITGCFRLCVCIRVRGFHIVSIVDPCRTFFPECWRCRSAGITVALLDVQVPHLRLVPLQCSYSCRRGDAESRLLCDVG